MPSNTLTSLAITGANGNQVTSDQAAVTPFPTLTVADPGATTETVSVTYAAANGTLAGGGFTGAAGSYSASFASASAAQAGLQALVFTPTANQAAPGSTVTTGFTVAVSDGQATATNAGASVVATSVNDPPTLSGLTAIQTATAGTALAPFAATTIADPDTGQTETVTVTFATGSSPGNNTFYNGEGGGAFAGAGFTGSGGSYSGTFASAAAAQAALRAATFTPTAGTTASDTLTVAVQDGPGGAATPASAATVLAVSYFPPPPALPAPLQGTVPNLAVTDSAPVSPYAGVVFNASVYFQRTTDSATVTVTDNAAASGTLAGGGFVQTAPGVYSVTESGSTAATYAAVQAALRALVFTPTANQVTPGATVTTAFTVTVSGSGNTFVRPTTVVVTSANDPPTLSGIATIQAATAGKSLAPFAAATVADPDVGQTETVTVTFAVGAGAFAGAGFTGSGGSYSGTFASAAAAQSALRAVTFTPTAGAAVSDTLTVSVQDALNGAATPTSAATLLAVAFTPSNTAPTILGTLGGQGDTAGTGIAPFANVTIADPDAGQAETVTVSFAAANGTLAGGGFVQAAPGVYSVTASAGAAGASAFAAQADLRAAVFTPTAGQSATTIFTVSVSDGSAIATDSLTSVVATYTPAASGGGSGPPSTPPSVQSGLSTTETPNLLRVAANSVDATTPGTPIYAQVQAEKAVAAQLDAGQITQAQAESALDHLADGTTAVAVASYAFFTGFTPSAAGLNYLVHSPANATDLNDAYYARFSTENRYINFAVSLATGVGAGVAAFQANYGALSLADATAKAYLAVFGAPADAAKVAALLNTLVPDGLGGQETRAQYFAQSGGDGPNGQGTKAAMVGFLLSNAVHDGSGVYGAATEHYLAALAHGTAPAMGSELALTYGPAVSLVGATPVADPTVTG